MGSAGHWGGGGWGRCRSRTTSWSGGRLCLGGVGHWGRNHPLALCRGAEGVGVAGGGSKSAPRALLESGQGGHGRCRVLGSKSPPRALLGSGGGGRGW